VLPGCWEGFGAVRVFRGATYRIKACKAAGAARGRVGYLVVDGKRVDGNLVPLAPEGATVEVEAFITAAALA
jgi:cellobiose phosphorylase